MNRPLKRLLQGRLMFFVQLVLASYLGLLLYCFMLWILGLRWLSVLWLGYGSY